MDQSPEQQDATSETSRTAVVLWLDAGLLLLFLLAIAPRLTGLALHEVVGIAFLVPLLAHLLLSWRWIASGVRRSLRPGARRARVNYLLNAALFVLTVTVVVAGLAISRVVLPALGIRTFDDGAWRFLHNNTVNWVHLAVALHIAMNWRWIVAATRRQLAAVMPVRRETEPAAAPQPRVTVP